jgi:uncharacterized protein
VEVSPFYEKQIECIHCKKQFPTLKVRSKSIRVTSTASDFQPVYSDTQVHAYHYNVFVCEHCGFSFTEDFTKYFAPGTGELISAQISSKWVHRQFNSERSVLQALEAYKLAYLCAVLKKEKNIVIAGLLLRLTWLYRAIENEAQEKRFMKMARDQYMESFSNEDYVRTQMSDEHVMYLIAELSRRLEDYQTATLFFSRVIERQRNTREQKIIEMAKEQWEILRVTRNQAAQQ